MLFAFITRLGLSRQDAEDVLQEVFIKVYKNLYKYNGRWCFSTWIYSIALNTFKTEYKKKKRASAAVFDETYMSSLISDSPEGIYESKELHAELVVLINSLEVEQRACLILKHVQGMSYNEIGDILGISADAAKMKVLRAKQKLCRDFDRSGKRGVLFEM
jgi:RNA polymerase sigma-70 factor (ECF subfamily)